MQCGYLNHYDPACPYYDEIFAFTIQISGRWKPDYWVLPNVGQGTRHTDPGTIFKQGRKLAKMGLEEQWWLARDDEQIILVGIDVSDPARFKYKSEHDKMVRLFNKSFSTGPMES